MFQMYISMIHHLYIVFGAHHPKPSYLLSPYLWQGAKRDVVKTMISAYKHVSKIQISGVYFYQYLHLYNGHLLSHTFIQALYGSTSLLETNYCSRYLLLCDKVHKIDGLKHPS